MNCPEFAENIVFYLDEELPPASKEAFAAHRAACASCRQLFTAVAGTYQVIDQERQISVRPYFYQRLKTKMARTQQKQRTGTVVALLKPLAVAASIALGVIIGNGELELLFNQDNEWVTAEETSLVMPAEYSVWVTMIDDDGSEN